MRLPFGLRKSAGIPVSGDTYRLISRGNAARDAQRWSDAAAAYRQSLRHASELAHIWIQLGHAEKEMGNLPEAEAAYRRASELEPAGPDSFLHLGHVAKDAGTLQTAARYYLAAALNAPEDPEPAVELQQVLARITPKPRRLLGDRLSEDLHRDLGGVAAAPTAGPMIYIDVSDLVAQALRADGMDARHGARARQALALLEGDSRMRLIAHVHGYPAWLLISPQQLRVPVPSNDLRDLENGDNRARAAARLGLELVFTPVVAFAAGDVLVSDLSPNVVPDHGFFVAEAERAGATLAPRTLADVDRAGAALLHDSSGAGMKAAANPAVSPCRPIGFAAGGEGLALRRGFGWLPPEGWGSWTHAEGVEIGMVVPAGEGPWRVSVCLRGLPDIAGDFRLQMGDADPIIGHLHANEYRWLALTIGLPSEQTIRIHAKGHEAQAVDTARDGQSMLASLGIVGLHVCRCDDRAARVDLLEAITFGNVRWN